MGMFPATVFEVFLTTVFLIVCLLLIVVVLLQKGRGGGLGGLFGGGGHAAFGTRTGDVFTWVTIILVAFFLVMAAGINRRLHPPRPQVSRPMFVPEPRPIEQPIPVTIQCRTPGAKVYFTYAVTGEELPEPTEASLLYEAPFRVEPGMTVKAKAFLQGWHDSEVQVGSYPHPDQLPAPPADIRLPETAAPGTQPAPPAGTGT